MIRRQPVSSSRSGFTLIELVVSMGLFIIAITVALVATVGTNGLLARTEARSVVTEGSRTVVDTVRRVTQNVGVNAVELMKDPTTPTNNIAIRVRGFSTDQKEKVCTFIGLVTTSKVNGEEKYTLSNSGTTIAQMIYPLSDTNVCPALTSATIYQNRLVGLDAKVIGLEFSLLDITCQNCTATQQLRYHLNIQTLSSQSGRSAQSRNPTIDLVTSLPIGLVATAFVTSGAPNGPTIDPITPPGGTVGTSYPNTQLSASGGTTSPPPAYRWSVVAGGLPPGLTLPTGGLISGTPTTGGTFDFTVRVTDAVNITADLPLTIIIAGNALQITTASPLPNATVSVAYSQTLAANGGSGSYTWSNGGLLIPQLSWLSISGGGVLSGTPSSSGGPYTYTAKVTDTVTSTFVTKDFSITINGAALSVTTASLPGGTVSTAYSQTLAATGGTLPYSWSLNPGSTPLPTGLSLSSGGVISGTPSAAATYPFTVKVTDSALASATKALSIVISPAAGFTITTASLPDGTLNTGYSQDVLASGGTTPYTWTLLSGTLPTGLTLSTISNNGRISGTPTASGTFNFTLKVTDTKKGTPLTATKSFTINIGNIGTPGGGIGPGG